MTHPLGGNLIALSTELNFIDHWSLYYVLKALIAQHKSLKHISSDDDATHTPALTMEHVSKFSPCLIHNNFLCVFCACISDIEQSLKFN